MNKRGQSIIEYTLIAVLVIFGIVIMGPYVLRSIGAHFKIWDDGVKDSFEENITQAPIGVVPNITPTCNWYYAPGSCGCDTVGCVCRGNQLIYNLTYLPGSQSGCAPPGTKSVNCELSDACCTTYNAGGCGTLALPSPTGAPVPTTGTNGLPPSGGCVSYGTTSCYIGQRAYSTDCSDLPYACCPDTNCGAQCSGQISMDNTQTPPVPTAVACPNEPPVSGALINPNGFTYVQADNQADCALLPGCTAALCSPPGGTPGTNCTYCDSSQTCQVSCATGYVLNSNTAPTACITPTPPGISCVYNGYPFSGTWTGDFSDACGIHDDNADNNNSYGDLMMTFQCNNNALVGLNSYYEASNGQCSGCTDYNHMYRGVNTSPPLYPVPSSATPVSCAFHWGGGGSETIYYQNIYYNSTCYDAYGNSSGHLPPASCYPGPAPSQSVPSCSNNSFTINCSNYELVSIVDNTSSQPASTLPNGCNWNGESRQISDFGYGNDMFITCSGGTITEFRFTPKTG